MRTRKVGLMTTALLATAAGAQEAMPRAELAGVERVVVRCQAAGPDEALRTALCARVAALARARTGHPVLVGSAPEAVPSGGGRHDLTVLVDVAVGEGGTLAVTLRRQRHPFLRDAAIAASSDQQFTIARAALLDTPAEADPAIARALDTLVFGWPGRPRF